MKDLKELFFDKDLASVESFFRNVKKKYDPDYCMNSHTSESSNSNRVFCIHFEVPRRIKVDGLSMIPYFRYSFISGAVADSKTLDDISNDYIDTRHYAYKDDQKMTICLLGFSSKREDEKELGNHYMRLIKINLSHYDENGKYIDGDDREEICNLLKRELKHYIQTQNILPEQCSLTLVSLDAFSKAYCPYGASYSRRRRPQYVYESEKFTQDKIEKYIRAKNKIFDGLSDSEKVEHAESFINPYNLPFHFQNEIILYEYADNLPEVVKKDCESLNAAVFSREYSKGNSVEKIEECITKIKCAFNNIRMSEKELVLFNEYLNIIQEYFITHKLMDYAYQIVKDLHSDVLYEIYSDKLANSQQAIRR